ncbi:MAG: hypothetical protein PSN46_04135 [Gammaproteobacteria bacterium]|nr:hypothetical protein [Gammaproteobacteria bacterium]
MSTAASTTKVIDLFSGREYQPNHRSKVVRLSPELDGFEVLYSNEHGHPTPGQKLYSVNILFWALLDDGTFTGMIPWFDQLIACTELNCRNKGFFQGYFDPGLDQAMPQVPEHKCIELITAADYFDFEMDDSVFIVQELADTCGSHAVFTADNFDHFSMTEVFSWRLFSDGCIQALIINPDLVTQLPVLVGDDCLVVCDEEPDFVTFFQYRIAINLKEHDADAIAALDQLKSD